MIHGIYSNSSLVYLMGNKVVNWLYKESDMRVHRRNKQDSNDAHTMAKTRVAVNAPRKRKGKNGLLKFDI